MGGTDMKKIVAVNFEAGGVYSWAYYLKNGVISVSKLSVLKNSQAVTYRSQHKREGVFCLLVGIPETMFSHTQRK